MFKGGVIGYRFLGLALCVVLGSGCTGEREAAAAGGESPTDSAGEAGKAVEAARTSDPYVGLWVNLKNSSKGLSIQPEDAAYIVENEDGEKYVGTKTDGILRISGPIGSIDVLYIKSSDRLVAAGVEYRRFDKDGPEGQAVSQRRTMADMRSIATAWEARATDTNSYSVDGILDGEITYAQLAAALSGVH